MNKKGEQRMTVQDKLTKIKNLYETYKEEFFTITDEHLTSRNTSSVTPTPTPTLLRMARMARMARIIVENGKSLSLFKKERTQQRLH